jgi:hypothetical protein
MNMSVPSSSMLITMAWTLLGLFLFLLAIMAIYQQSHQGNLTSARAVTAFSILSLLVFILLLAITRGWFGRQQWSHLRSTTPSPADRVLSQHDTNGALMSWSDADFGAEPDASHAPQIVSIL